MFRHPLWAARLLVLASSLVACEKHPTAPTPPPAPKVVFTSWRGVDWSALFVGRVTNQGNAMAYTVWVTTSLHQASAISSIVTPDSLAPGENGDFYAQGDRVPLLGFIPPVVVQVIWSATRP